MSRFVAGMHKSVKLSITWFLSLRHLYDLGTAACERVALLAFVMISGKKYLVAAATKDIRHGVRGVI